MRRPGGKKTLEPEQAADAILARNVATHLLAGRDHAVADLSRKLQQRGFSPAAIARAVAELQPSKALNDERYGQKVVRYRSRRGQGPARIRLELRKSGVDSEVAEAAVKGGDDAPDFAKLARETRVRKFGPEVPKDWKERSKQARFLQYRGFSNDHIRAALEGDVEDASPDPDGKPDQS
jgi:regulatory protein